VEQIHGGGGDVEVRQAEGWGLRSQEWMFDVWFSELAHLNPPNSPTYTGLKVGSTMSNFDPNAIIRGVQLTVVGGR
jgi:hypothetical protein